MVKKNQVSCFLRHSVACYTALLAVYYIFMISVQWLGSNGKGCERGVICPS